MSELYYGADVEAADRGADDEDEEYFPDHPDPAHHIRKATRDTKKSLRDMEKASAARKTENKRLEESKEPCPNCGLPVVTPENHRVRLGRGVFQVGDAIEVRRDKDATATFDGCVECLTRPAAHWETMNERVYELEQAASRHEDRARELEGKLAVAVGTLYLRWWVVGLALLAWEVLRLLVWRGLAG